MRNGKIYFIELSSVSREYIYEVDGGEERDRSNRIYLTCVGVGFDDENFMRDSLALELARAHC